MQLYVWCPVINTTLSTLLVNAKEMFSFQQELSGETVHLIVDSWQHLKKLSLDGVCLIVVDDAICIIKNLGKQLTTLVLHGELHMLRSHTLKMVPGNIRLYDVTFSFLHNFYVNTICLVRKTPEWPLCVHWLL
jgi:hypothetical protein